MTNVFISESQKPAQDWWLAVRQVATLIEQGTVAADEDQTIRRSLLEQGFSADGVHKALEWIDLARMSGSLHVSLGMIQDDQVESMRVMHPLETASIHEDLLRSIHLARGRGLLTRELSERLIEALRAIDTRDWDSGEVAVLLKEVLAATAPNLAELDICDVLREPLQIH